LVGVVSERVVFRELFLKGLTMLDFKENAVKLQNTISSNTARQELSALVNKIWGTDLNLSPVSAIQK
jgi:chromosome partitioning protein